VVLVSVLEKRLVYITDSEKSKESYPRIIPTVHQDKGHQKLYAVKNLKGMF